MTSILQQQDTLLRVESFKPDNTSCTINEYLGQGGMKIAVIEKEGSEIKVYAAFANQTPGCAVSLAVQRIVSKSLSSAYSNTDTSTDTSHPMYTLESAGWEELAKVLPAYLKRILSPTTNDAAKAELLDTDEKPHSLEVMYREACRLLYLENAQRALTPDQILQYHRDVYQLRNLRLVIVGEHDHLPQIQNELDSFARLSLDPVRPPALDTIRRHALKETMVTTVEIPEDDESVGKILICLFGPDYVNMVETSAINILLEYLRSSLASRLMTDSADNETLGKSLTWDWMPQSQTVIRLWLMQVPTERLEVVEKRVTELLQDTADNPVDMHRMRECIQQEKKQDQLEAKTSELYFPYSIISEWVSDNGDDSTLRKFQSLSEYGTLEEWTGENWWAFLRKLMVDAHHVSVLGKPSRELGSLG
ncbi:putative zinc metalloprotease [Metarhizium anisopliae]|nr:putative zinc metalloprotease [Metarhizium anisopliae]